MDFAQFLRTPFLTEHLQWLLLNYDHDKSGSSLSSFLLIENRIISLCICHLSYPRWLKRFNIIDLDSSNEILSFYFVASYLDSSQTGLDSSGSDCIQVLVLKNCKPELSYIYKLFFYMCLKESCFPCC